jgi:hypothetical protein
VQYRATVYIFRIVLFYWIAVQLGSTIVLGLWLRLSEWDQVLLDSEKTSPYWFSAFVCVTGFNQVRRRMMMMMMMILPQAGMTLVSDGLYRFASHRGTLVMVVMMMMMMMMMMMIISQAGMTLVSDGLYRFASHRLTPMMMMMMMIMISQAGMTLVSDGLYRFASHRGTLVMMMMMMMMMMI